MGVPNLPGVPALASYALGSAGSLILADTFIGINAILGSGWGIYMDGAPVIVPATALTQGLQPLLSPIASIAAAIGFPNVVPVVASTVEFDFSADSPISNYPQEEGAFQSYNKVKLPFNIRMKLASAGSPAQRQSFTSTVMALRVSNALVDVVTPERVFAGVNCKHVDWLRRNTNGVELIVADMWFEEVPFVASTTFSNTLDPSSAGTTSIGNVQPTGLAGAAAKQITKLGGAPF